ncbi:hypothetical protein AB0B88_16400 [Micromonospora haikouensis]|uniref:hypothetical protein n=1 Tax=Micromonospora haikouensis TaxID=686309 RepID=UPI0033CDB501
MDLDDTSRCPRGDRCATCGGGDGLAVATVATAVGVHCLTLCVGDREAERLPRPASWTQAIELAAAHCTHLGIDVDAMAAAMEQEGGKE